MSRCQQATEIPLGGGRVDVMSEKRQSKICLRGRLLKRASPIKPSQPAEPERGDFHGHQADGCRSERLQQAKKQKNPEELKTNSAKIYVTMTRTIHNKFFICQIT